MPRIFYLDTTKIDKFSNYTQLIQRLQSGTLTPGSKEKLLQKLENGDHLCRLRETRADRLHYVRVQSGDYKGAVVLCDPADGHKDRNFFLQVKNPQSNLRKLGSPEASSYYLPYPELEEATEAQEVPESEEISLNYSHVIELDEDQKEVTQRKLPLLLRGNPGSGKTFVAQKMMTNYAHHPMRNEDGEPVGFLYVAPSQDLADKAQEDYDIVCEDFLASGVEPAPGTFVTYADYFANYTREGKIDKDKQRGFEDFEAYYKPEQYENNQYKITPPSAIECWAAFELCGFFSDDKKGYMALGKNQCALSLEMREVVYEIFKQYEFSCEKAGAHSQGISLFRSEEMYGLVILDESQTQPPVDIKSYYYSALEGRFVAIVGYHQTIDTHASIYARRISGAELLQIALYEKGVIFDNACLSLTYRNSEAAVNLANAIIAEKKRFGYDKNTGGFLQGNNGDAGEADFIYEAESDKVKALQDRFLVGSRDVCVITQPFMIERLKEMWPGVTVLCPAQALGLEWQELICVRLLGGDEEKVKEFYTALQLVQKNISLTPQESAPIEPWFTNVITALTRAKNGVHFIEANPDHRLKAIVDPLKSICDTYASPSLKKTTLSASSPEEWLAYALGLINARLPDANLIKANRAEAMRLMDFHIKDKNSPTYLTFMEAYKTALPKEPPQSSMDTDTEASKKKRKKKKNKASSVDTPEIPTEVEAPGNQALSVVPQLPQIPELAEPVMLNEISFDNDSQSHAEPGAGKTSGKKKNNKNKKTSSTKSLSVAIEEYSTEYFRARQFISYNYGRSTQAELEKVFIEAPSLLLRCVFKNEAIENLIEFFLDLPDRLKLFFRALEKQTPEVMAKFFNATDIYGRSGLGVLLYELMKNTDSLREVYKLFKKNNALYKLVSHKTWYLTSKEPLPDWRTQCNPKAFNAPPPDNRAECSPLQLIVLNGGINFLSDLLSYNPRVFTATTEFGHLLTTKVFRVKDSEADKGLLPLFELVKESEIKTVNTFFVDLVGNNSAILNPAFVDAFCETCLKDNSSALSRFCSYVMDNPLEGLGFIKNLFNALAGEKLLSSRQVVIDRLCTKSGKYTPLFMLVYASLRNEDIQKSLKKIFEQYIGLFNPELLGQALVSYSSIKDDSDHWILFNILAMLFATLIGQDIVLIILDKLPAVAQYITADALCLNIESKERRSIAIRKLFENEQGKSTRVLSTLLKLNQDLPQQFNWNLLRTPQQGWNTVTAEMVQRPFIYKMIEMYNGINTLSMFFSQSFLPGETTEEDLFTTHPYGLGKYWLYLHLLPHKKGCEILESIMVAKPSLKMKPLCELLAMPNDLPPRYCKKSVFYFHCQRPEGRKILRHFVGRDSQWFTGIEVKILFEQWEDRSYPKWEEDDDPDIIAFPLHGLCLSEEDTPTLRAILTQNPNLAEGIRKHLSKTDDPSFPLSLLNQWESGVALLKEYFPEISVQENLSSAVDLGIFSTRTFERKEYTENLGSGLSACFF